MADILLVDNDARIVELMAFFLGKHGHRVRTARSFSEARARIVERPPDLMLSDVDLGAESGRAELPRMAREGLLPPTLVVSGYLDRDLDAFLYAIPGVVSTLAKPFDLAELEARVAQCLTARRSGVPAPGDPGVIRSSAGEPAPAIPSRGWRDPSTPEVPAQRAGPAVDDEGWIEITPGARRRPTAHPPANPKDGPEPR